MGYISLANRQSDVADRALDRALALHHRQLPITLLNQAVLSLDRGEWEQAQSKISDALLLTTERQQVPAGYLALRLLPTPSGHSNVEFEQNPANTLETGYVNLVYALAKSNHTQMAEDVLEEGMQLLPSSAYLRFAGARLHMYTMRADLADPIYLELSTKSFPNTMAANEIRTAASRAARSLKRRDRRKR